VLDRIVWTAVAAAVLSIGTVIAALLSENSSLIIALGSAALVAAVLASRER
jgi:hypothetical protein